eukprot:4250390-Lingulodinium_polyedra.AAC.1
MDFAAGLVCYPTVAGDVAIDTVRWVPPGAALAEHCLTGTLGPQSNTGLHSSILQAWGDKH